MNLMQMRPNGHADRLVHEEAHLCTTNSVQTILERVDCILQLMSCDRLLWWHVILFRDGLLKVRYGTLEM